MQNNIQRRGKARQIRRTAAESGYLSDHDEQLSNGDETRYASQNYFANYSKGLPHDANGEVVPADYEAFVRAAETGSFAAYEALPLGFANGRKFTNPLAGYSFDLEGGDAQRYSIPPAPAFASAEVAAEMVELYWMALARDVCFTDYGTDATIAKAVTDLESMSDYRGNGPGLGQVTKDNIFRGFTDGDRVGPYLSQFLLRDIPYGSLCISQKQKTAKAGVNFLTVFSQWLNAQRGKDLALPYDPCAALPTDRIGFDPTRRHIRNLRDLATYVHYDALYEAYLNACLILLGMNAPFDKGNPYAASKTQAGFGTFGGPHILSLVTEVATRALKAVWHQKWNVNRRLRPEAFGGRVHLHKSGTKLYPIHPDLLNSQALVDTQSSFGSWLLPMAFAEGSPTHPAYGAGHATVAGACTTILKAWFEESWVIPNPVVAKCDGLSLEPYTGPESLTVGGELNKVAANVSIGRNAAGVHYWTDYTASLALGESIAIDILREQKLTFAENFSFSLQKFDGTAITI